ncbi:MAG TPA: aspartate dehydrogenase [Candidatus Acidoferrales bacterium]|nr:aspartate dehydrogenase [Candidatus Acidoferrales bacterium]
MNNLPVLRIGIFGVGAIGQTIATAVAAAQIDAQLVGLADKDTERAESFASTLSSPPRLLPLHELIQRSDLVVEAASQEALREFVPKAMSASRDVLIMSVGGLLGHEDWFRQAEEKRCRIYVPSGAIAGLDGIKSACMGSVQSAMLTSRKPLAALRGTKYVVEHCVQLDGLSEETVIFEGTAEEAARAFPTTSNVAASLRLAVDRNVPVCVRVVAVPGGSKNVHEIRVFGEFGRLSVDVENVPSKSNPRTSQLAAFSALATLKNLTRSLRVGT